MEDPNLGLILTEAILKGFFQGIWIFIKVGWWFIILIILFKIFERGTNKKIDIWKKKRK